VTANGSLEVFSDVGETTGLGKGLSKNEQLNTYSVRTSIAVLKKFVSLCRQQGVEEIAVVGTNALRLAQDADQFIKQVRDECGILPKVISEKEEASLSFLSVQQDPLMPHDAVVMDIGGGSTEFIFYVREKRDHSLQSISLALGAVSLTEKFLLHDPPTSDEITKLSKEIENALSCLPIITMKNVLVGIGGTATTLGSMHLGLDKFNRELIHGRQLTMDKLVTQVRELQTMDIESRKKIAGLPDDRADIICAGAMIILASMKKMGKTSIYISCKGIRYGLFYQQFMGAT
jgi:exopolyphosphatase/guanosine-5'-triphosphate,3'-diphosphate pyrophosphatase